jgi:hypothetical protein
VFGHFKQEITKKKHKKMYCVLIRLVPHFPSSQVSKEIPDSKGVNEWGAGIEHTLSEPGPLATHETKIPPCTESLRDATGA